VIEVTEQDDVAVLRLADGKVNAMSMEFCETLTSPNSKLTPNHTSRKPRGPPPRPAGSARRHEATFLSRRPRRSSVRHRQPRLTVTPRSAAS